MNYMNEALALIAIVLTLAGYAQYVRTMLAGKTKPHVFSWLIWATLTAIGFFAQVADGAGPGAWVTGLSAVIPFCIAFYAMGKGRTQVTRSDIITFLACLSAIPVWLATDDPLGAVIIVTVIDALAFYPTFRKSWGAPDEENLFQYTMAAIKFALAVAALEHYSVVTALYPASLVVMNALFIAFTLARRRAVVAG